MSEDDGDGLPDEIDVRPVDDMTRMIEECDRHYSFLLGSGTSVGAGIPTGGELVEEWKQERHEQINPDADFEEWVDKKEEEMDEKEGEYGFWFEQVHPASEQRRTFVRDLVGDRYPTIEHIVLASIMIDKEGAVPPILTTNFDDLLFESFYLFLDEKPLVVDHDALVRQYQLTDETPTIIKLHGDYMYDNLKNTEEEKEKLEENMEEALRRVMDEFGLIILGYSGRDESIMGVLDDLDIPDQGLFWCAMDKNDLSDDVVSLLERPNTFLVEIEDSRSLLRTVAEELDVPLPDTAELRERAEERRKNVMDELRQSEEESEDEEESYFGKWRLLSEGNEKYEAGNYEEAIEDFNRAIELDPEYSGAYYNRGNARKNMGEYEEAIEDFNRAIEHNAANIHAYQNRAELYIELGEYDDALDDAQTALELSDSTDEEVQSLMLLLIAKILLNEDISDEEEEYRELCIEEFETDWSFKEFDEWLEDADIDGEKEGKIREIIDLLREHKPNNGE